ncbi:hypothetical protein FB567DRAFT_552 [Paraphoma chrysanthemicola]|uniref:Uncharacterized protein n=1 Tax=Paraphoma chrysanthemicola TaxID=798071 RepID=A0A8K0RG90_9PLEO|nr:hypothetical protein FB567DRAFT_552 [Paraphoma chrysanthemicola]
MASKLCCTAEEEGRSDSPELPNARMSAAIPAARPLLPKPTVSLDSRFTSAQSDELYELRQIFDNAQDHGPATKPPQKGSRAGSSQPSIISLRSLHKMTSMRSIIRRKFSRDLSKKDKEAFAPNPNGKKVDNKESATVVKHEEPNRQLRVTKDDLRKDLLSDKRPAQGGYDSDAQVLDDIARNIGRKTPGKRPSIHSVDWSPSTASKSTPESAHQRRDSMERKRNVEPYQIEKPPAMSLSARFTQVFSTPNLRADGVAERDRRLRRSHSATSMGLPKPSPISPLRLPSLKDHDQDGIPWSEVMSKSLRLSQFPLPPQHASLKSSETRTDLDCDADKTDTKAKTEQVRSTAVKVSSQDVGLSTTTRTVEIRIQQPTSITSLRPSTSVRGSFRENAPPPKDSSNNEAKDEEEDNPRRSVHLYSMRISHHLRSGSLLSWDQLADAPELPTPPRPFRDRTVSDQSRSSHIQRQLARHERQTSSSGFHSSNVPSKWGKVLTNERDLRADVASSIYSSRPQSPPDSFGGSMVNLSRPTTGYHMFSHSSVDLKKHRRSNSFPTDNEETPRPAQRYRVTNMEAAQELSIATSLLAAPAPLARKNSVAETKKSKFREEFSPSPPKKKIAASTSIMKFLNPKRLSMRSLSDANFQSGPREVAVDGVFDTLPVPSNRERRHSRSTASVHSEQESHGKNKGANDVWDQALKTHQEEKASMFLPKNKALAVNASPFRERSGSFSGRRPSVIEDIDPVVEASTTPKRYSAPMLVPSTPRDTEQRPTLVTRCSATVGKYDAGTGEAIAMLFESQGDSPAVVGAWGRYPSHTRVERTVSVSKTDRVQTRDFALEAAIRFASARDNDYDEDMVDPIECTPSPPFLPGEKKRKKRVGSGKMSKSHSMTFGRKLIKNYYSGIFKSSSSEFRQHGRGHRSSIASGGTLEHPELELLPEVFMSGGTDGASDGSQHRSDKQVVRRHSERHKDAKASRKLPIGDSMATLRPRRNSSAPNLSEAMTLHDGAGDADHDHDRARVWSVYYGTCIPSFPRASTDLGLEEFGSPSRHSLESKRASLRSNLMSTGFAKHSRNASQMSRMSRASARPSFVSMGDDEAMGEEKSVVGVRRSTMDLISRFREQEATEHERVLSLTRAESSRMRAL